MTTYQSSDITMRTIDTTQLTAVTGGGPKFDAAYNNRVTGPLKPKGAQPDALKDEWQEGLKHQYRQYGLKQLAPRMRYFLRGVEMLKEQMSQR